MNGEEPDKMTDGTGREASAGRKKESIINSEIIENYGPWMMAPRRSRNSQYNMPKRNREENKVKKARIRLTMLNNHVTKPIMGGDQNMQY